uniref:G1/S-specific cyclin-D2-like n=1 Tax=Hirondellea gigas TaxID=1518452 RepID=A0A2P2IA77_9CRUS
MDELLCTESTSSINTPSNNGETPYTNTCSSSFSTDSIYDKHIYENPKVLETLLASQMKNLPSNEYLKPNRSNVTTHIRNVLVHWMLDLCDDRNCEDQVFIVAVNLLDRFLSSMTILRSQLQLAACVCLLIASKIRQTHFLDVQTLSYFTEDSITHLELKQWEVLVLAKLGWDMTPVTSFDFIEPLLSLFAALPNRERVRKHALAYIAYVATDFEFVSRLPSHIAAAAIVVALEGLGIYIPFSMERLVAAVNSTISEIQPTKSLIEMSVYNYMQSMNAVNHNNNEISDNHFLGENKFAMDSTSKINGKVTPTDVTDIQF